MGPNFWKIIIFHMNFSVTKTFTDNRAYFEAHVWENLFTIFWEKCEKIGIENWRLIDIKGGEI